MPKILICSKGHRVQRQKKGQGLDGYPYECLRCDENMFRFELEVATPEEVKALREDKRHA